VVFGNWDSETGKWYSETGKWYSETGQWYSETRNPVFGNWELYPETRKWYLETGSCIRKRLFGNWNPGIGKLSRYSHRMLM
jgi:hypothetical protein